MSQPGKRPGPLEKPGSSFDRQSAWFFELRLREETYRATRYGLAFSVVAAVLPTGHSPYDDTELADVFRRVSENLRFLDVAGVVVPNVIALCLPHTERAGAEVVADRLFAAVQPFNGLVGIAVCPGDAVDAEALVELAVQRATQGG